MESHDRTELTAEAEGATLGEAKWNAVKLLEPRFPGVSADCVSFEVLDEGDGEGDVPARVRVELNLEAWERGVGGEIPDEPAERVRAVVGRVVSALGLRASVDIEEDDEEIRATVNGDELGLLIGRHGTTIDALQHIAMRAAFHGLADHKAVVVDAAGYRERREAALHRAADRAVEDALSYGRPVELEPMGPHERRAVHMYLRDRAEVQTHSEGDEPDRRLVVTPVRGSS
jgi:spoIIIJ-associated protein